MPAYPFVPKSNRYVEAGQFWALPLSDGRYGCGRVMAVPAFGAKDRVGFVAGLAGWIGSEPPTEATIAGAPVRSSRRGRTLRQSPRQANRFSASAPWSWTDW